MHETDIVLPDGLLADNAALPEAIDALAAEFGLTCTLKGALSAYPGCTHWHFKHGRARGTLELTWWPARHRLWFKIASNRRGAWMDATILAFAGRLNTA
jgi:hypothetical protein